MAKTVKYTIYCGFSSLSDIDKTTHEVFITLRIAYGIFFQRGVCRKYRSEGIFGCAENSEGDGGARAENENRAAAGRGEKAVGDAKMLSLYIKHFNLFAQI